MAVAMMLGLGGKAAAQPSLSVGSHIGSSVATLIGIEGATPRIGFTAGVSAALNFSPAWGIEMGFAVSDQGAKANIEKQQLQMTYTYNYMNVPLLLTYTPGGGHWTIFGGAQLGLPLAASYHYSTPSITNPEEGVTGGGLIGLDEMHPTELGVSLGVRYWLSHLWGLEARYTCGITQTHNGISNLSTGHQYISVPDNRNSVLQLCIFVRF